MTQEISEVMLLADLIYEGFPHSFISPFTLTFRSFSIVREIFSPTFDILTVGFFLCMSGCSTPKQSL